MPVDSTAVVDRLLGRLRTDAGAGGWGYYTGKSSRIEPTCWALLALGSGWTSAASEWDAVARPHMEFLQARQGAEGLLIETEPALASFGTNGLAALVLTRYAAQVPRDTVTRLFGALVASKGVRVENADPVQDNTLQGWPWVRDTFSWAEPTSWCLLALKRASADNRGDPSAARIAEAERLMIDRTCRTGGWNYGNASALGQELRAYVPTTALGLLAMQDRRDDPAIQRSLAFFDEAHSREQTASALALASLALRVYGRATDDVDERLVAAVATSERLGNLQAMAMAVYALTSGRHDVEAFRVSV